MYLTRRFYIALILVILLLGSGYLFAPFFVIGQWALFALFVLVSADGYILYRTQGIQAFRQCSDRFSNGDDNEVSIRVESTYSRPLSLEIIDEIPLSSRIGMSVSGPPFSRTRGKQSVTIFVRPVAEYILTGKSVYL